MNKKTIIAVVISLIISVLLGPNVMWKLNSTLSNVNQLMWNIQRLEDRFNKKSNY